MKLTKVIIDNLFAYKGVQEIDFSPVTCVIGINGFGKTSILNSIKLGLGAHEIKNIESILNNNAESKQCSISLVFDIFTIKRAWDFSAGIEDHLSISFPEEEVENINGIEAEHYISNKIPKFLVDFVFYDGEIGSNLFLLSSAKMKNIFDYVFDLDLLSHVQKDSMQVARKLLEQNKDEETFHLVEKEKQRLKTIERIKEREEELIEREKEKKKSEKNIKKLDTQIRNRNKKIKVLHEEKDDKKSRMEQLSQKIKTVIMFEMPLLLNPELLKEMEKKSHSPLTLNDESMFIGKFDKFMDQIDCSIETEKALSVFKKLMLTKSGKMELSIQKDEWIRIMEELKELQHDINKLDAKIQAASANIMEHEITKSLIESRKEQENELSVLSQDIQNIINEIGNKEAELKETTKLLAQMFRENQDKYAFIKGYEELMSVSSAAGKAYTEELDEKLDIFNETLKRNTLSFLKQYEHINHIYINKNHEIVITDGEKKLETELLSAGQKQILNFLIVKSILEYKSFASFVMVDTPFGRISNENKKLLLNDCYLRFDNLILLLTDNEFEFVEKQNLKKTVYNIKRNQQGAYIEKVENND